MKLIKVSLLLLISVLMNYCLPIASFSQGCVRCEEVVTQVYGSAFRRTPNESELNSISTRIANNSLTVRNLVMETMTSQEYRARYLYPIIISETYQRLLRRPASQSEFNSAINFLGSKSPMEFFKSIAKSEEHYNLFLRPLDPKQAIEVLEKNMGVSYPRPRNVPPIGSPGRPHPLLETYKNNGFRAAID